jgi:hypothetical protein
MLKPGRMLVVQVYEPQVPLEPSAWVQAALHDEV